MVFFRPKVMLTRGLLLSNPQNGSRLTNRTHTFASKLLASGTPLGLCPPCAMSRMRWQLAAQQATPAS